MHMVTHRPHTNHACRVAVMGLEGVWGSLQEGTSNFKDAAADPTNARFPIRSMYGLFNYLHLGRKKTVFM